LPLKQSTFLGYRRPTGRAGVRNHLLILSINGLVGPAARRAARALPGSKLVATPYGRGQLGPDQEAHRQQLIGLGANPNAGAMLVLGADRKSVDAIADSIAASGKPVDAVALDDVGEDSLALSERAVRTGARLAHAISRARREPVPASELCLGIECGHSDATSGLAANPVAGGVADLLVDVGGVAMIGETLEWLGAEHILAKRAVDPAVAGAITAAVSQREAAVARMGVDLLGNNPGEENIRGGLSTIEEKSLGAIAKGGSRPVAGVLSLAEAPQGKGLYVMDAPGFSPESLTGFAAAGAQIMLFTTGPGNSFCNLLAPTIKLSGHPEAAESLAHQIDFDASAVLSGREAPIAAADRLFSMILDVASGSATWGEILDEGDEVFARLGPSF